MTSMDLNTLTWCGRGSDSCLLPPSLHYTLKGINDRIMSADRRLADAHGMIGIGFADRSGQIGSVATNLGTINAYVGHLPSDVAALLDDPLFTSFANGPTEAISKIRAEDITTANTPGLTQETTVDPGDGTPPVTTVFTPGVISFSDLALSTDTGESESFFAEIFADAHLSYVAGDNEYQNLSDYVQQLVTSGEFDHQGYHPVKDFISALLDVTGVWAIFKAVTGHDPITGEDLHGWGRVLEGGMGVVNLVALLLAIPTGGGSLEAATWLRGAATSALRVLVVNAVATGASLVAYDTAIDMGLPPWAATLLALGVGFTIGLVGTKYVILDRNGVPVGEPIEMHPTGDLPPTGKPNSFGYDALGNRLPTVDVTNAIGELPQGVVRVAAAADGSTTIFKLVDGKVVALTYGRVFPEGMVPGAVVDEADLVALRARLGVPKTETVAVGSTNIPGVDGVFEGGAPRVHGEAGLPKWVNDPTLTSSDIQSPKEFDLRGQNHAEGEVLARIDVAITNAGIDPNVKGTVTVIQSKPTGVCPSCKSGLGNEPEVATGVIKQFSLKYPNLKIIIRTAGELKPDYVVMGGTKLS